MKELFNEIDSTDRRKASVTEGGKFTNSEFPFRADCYIRDEKTDNKFIHISFHTALFKDSNIAVIYCKHFLNYDS